MFTALSKKWLSPASTSVLSIIRHLPLVSGLPDCKLTHFVESGKEVFVNFLLSTSPLWLGSLITFSVDRQPQKTFGGYMSVLTRSLSDGEMLIYATAAIAPMFYFSLIRAGGTRDFPGRLSHIVSGLLIFMICTTLFGVQRSGAKIDPNFVLPGSLIMYCIAMAIIFVATTYRNWRDGAEKVISKIESLPQTQEDDFVKSAREHRNG